MIKYKLDFCGNKNYEQILNIFNSSSNNFFLTKIKNSYIVDIFCQNQFPIIYVKNNEEYIGFLIFNTYTDDKKKYIIINAEYITVIKKYQSNGLSTKLLKYFVKNINKIIYKIKKKTYKSIYISAILVNPRSFSNIFDINKTFPATNKIKFDKKIIENVKKLNTKFIYLNDYICFNIFAIKIKIFFDYMFNTMDYNENFKLYEKKIGLPIGLGFYVSTITKIK